MLICLWWLGGCSAFDQKWEAAGEAPQAEHRLDGQWEGEWISANGHRGALKCAMERIADGEYSAWYRATYEKVFTFEYQMTLRPHRVGPAFWRFSGCEDLGWLAGGAYRYEGDTNGSDLKLEYQTSCDQGYFELSRVVQHQSAD